VDYIKADDIARPLHAAEIEALHRAIIKSGRSIVLSLSPGPADLAQADFYAANANLWRVSDDFWDLWKDLRAAFGYLDRWSSHVRPGGWPDGDMLPLGRIGMRAERGDDRSTRFTHDEQRTLITLWSIARSPLMFGGDMPSLDPWTLGPIAASFSPAAMTLPGPATRAHPANSSPSSTPATTALMTCGSNGGTSASPARLRCAISGRGRRWEGSKGDSA
jgi:hypothetical protein